MSEGLFAYEPEVSRECAASDHSRCTQASCKCGCGHHTIEAARAARDESIAQVDAAADAAWRVTAKTALWALIRTGAEFSTDDLWDGGLPKPREPRALGPVILAAKRKGYIVDTGRMVQSRYRHATKITVWQGVG